MQSGKSPVGAVQLATAIMTEPAGVKPRPVEPLGSEMVDLPVYINLEWSGGGIILRASGWVLRPCKRGEQGLLMIECQLPATHWIGTHQAPEGIPSAAVELIDLAPSEVQIPEFAGLDPAIFQSDPERHSANMRAMNTKPQIGQQQS